MNQVQFSFRSLHDDEFIRSASAMFGIPFSPQHLTVPDQCGSGSVVRSELASGFHLFSFDVCLRQEILFIKQQATIPSFIIAFILDTESIQMRSPSIQKKFVLKGSRNVLFLSNDVELHFEVPAGNRLQVVLFNMSASWLQQEFGDGNEAFRSFMDKLYQHTDPVVFIESSSADEFRMLDTLLPKGLHHSLTMLPAKAKAGLLIAGFFERVFKRSPADILHSRILHHEKMQEVETLLKAHLEKNLPDLEWIARQVMLSVSSLRRHFKLLYGKTIYDYYLELKMEHAQRLLLERPLSVNEVAAVLNYEKVSSFIEMFKKHHGISPGLLKRNIM